MPCVPQRDKLASKLVGRSLAQQLLNRSPETQLRQELSLQRTEPSCWQQAAAGASSVPWFCISIWSLFSAGAGWGVGGS